MAGNRGRPEPDGRGLGRLVVDDVLRGDLRRSLRRDLAELYEFYLDDDRRRRLARMGRVRRWLHAALALLGAALRRLPPARRVLLVAGIALSLASDISIRVEERRFSVSFPGVGFGLVLLVLMLELKDKLLAREELEVGRSVQLALLPDAAPRLGGWDLWLYTRPANDVGGDLVDYLWLEDGRLAITLGDVAGKGLGAALLMAKLQSTLRALAARGLPLEELGAEVNRILVRDGVRGRFATLLHLEIEAGSGSARVLNAGHHPPIALRAAGGSDELRPVALPVGVRADAKFAEQRLDLAPGDTLLLYSDGVTEALDGAGRLYGGGRLRALLPALAGLDAEACGRRILQDVDAFVGEARPSDDLSLAVLRRTG